MLSLNFLLLFTAHLLFGFSFWPYVLLPVFLQNLGSDLAAVGIIMGVASVSGMLIRPWTGNALERIGRRKCLLIGGAIFFVTHLLYLSIDHMGPLIYIVRLLHGLSMGILFATFFTFAADIAPETRRTEGIALFGIGGHLSGAFGVPLGEFIIQHGGYAGLFQACAGFTLLFIILCYFLKEPANDHEKPVFHWLRFLQSAFHSPNRVPLAVTGLFALGLVSYMVFLKPYAHENGFSVTPFFMAYSLSAVLIRLAGGKWPDRFGLKTVLYPSIFLLALGITLLAFWASPLGLLISGIFCGVGHGFIFPILSVLLINRAPGNERGARMALFTLFFDIGLFIGSPLWGFIADGFGYQAMFLLSATGVLSGIAVFIFMDAADARATEIEPPAASKV